MYNPKLINLMMRDIQKNFQNSCVTEVGLPNFQKMILHMLRSHLPKLEPKFIKYNNEFWLEICKEDKKFQDTELSKHCSHRKLKCFIKQRPNF